VSSNPSMIALVHSRAFGKLRAVKLLAPVQSALLLVLLFAVGGLSANDEKPRAPAGTNSAVEAESLIFKGKVIKLPGETNAVGFRTEKGDVYPLVRNQKSEALFVETNLVEKTLILKGRLEPRTRALEITANLHSWHGGKQREIYYYCDICAIKTSEPGPCMCCREPMKFVEEE
jgi:hypothetical protein